MLLALVKEKESPEEHLLLGQVLIKSGAINEDQLKIALNQQKNLDLRLGEVLIKQNFTSEEAMKQALCEQLDIPFVSSIAINKDLSRVINSSYAEKHRIIPIAITKNNLTLVMDDPTNNELTREIKNFIGYKVSIVTSTRSIIEKALKEMYGIPGIPENNNLSGLEIVEDETSEDDKPRALDAQQEKKANALVTEIIRIGLKKLASDIHLESDDKFFKVRYRIDGVLQELNLGPLQEEINRSHREIISFIKILAKLDIAERRRPQDGSFRIQVVKDGDQCGIDFRVSVVRSYYGENVVLRVLDSRKAPKSIDELKFPNRTNKKTHELLRKNTGILLVTGPTGSGKSTTLYAALMTAYKPGIKILTAEDPIEYVYSGIIQCEINPKIGNTFARYIRTFLRQDPEIILIGEIRDGETAEMAFGAAQTGHLVLSTLHTNDAVSATTRLLDLGVEPSLITSCLLGVLAQRLIRKICTHCKKEYSPAEEIISEFFTSPPNNLKWYDGEGCQECNYTGYKGRLAVIELWTPSEQDMLLISKGASIEEIRKSAESSTIFMAEDAMNKIKEGTTNLEELIRTLPHSCVDNLRHYV